MLTASIAATIAVFSFYGWNIWEKGKKGWNKYSITLGILLTGYLIVSISPPLAKFYKTIKKQLDLFRFNSDYLNDYFNDFSLPAIGFILAIIGTYFIYKKLGRKKEAAFIFFSAFMPLLFAVFTWVRFPAQRYIYFTQSFGIILASCGVYYLTIYLYNHFEKKKKLAVVILLIIFVATLNFSYFKKENLVYWHTKNSFYPDFKKIFPYILENKSADDIFVTRAYRSYYWRGDNVKVSDLQALPLEEKNCHASIEEIISQNKSGWFILPDIDNAFICKEGREYLSGRFNEIKNESIPNTVSVYRWSN
jgi:hypothetical protein